MALSNLPFLHREREVKGELIEFTLGPLSYQVMATYRINRITRHKALVGRKLYIHKVPREFPLVARCAVLGNPIWKHLGLEETVDYADVHDWLADLEHSLKEHEESL